MAGEGAGGAVITGGAGGIGFAFASALAERGVRLAIADISEEKAQDAAARLGAAAKGYGCDVTCVESLERLAAAIERDFGHINWLFANAGVAIGGKLTETSLREFEWLFDVNVTGTFRTIQTLFPLLQKSAAKGLPARVVFTGSENSVGLPTTGEMTAYTATKHAVLALADGLRRDLQGSGIDVSIFCPGLVNTGLWDSRRVRQDRYGGSEAMPEQEEEFVKNLFASEGQDPALTARIALEGIDRGDFIIITDPKIRSFATERHGEVERALDALDDFLVRNGIAAQDAVV
jgi:NAD(P)-dependent dehydrogenase (short-subunit alcohol dehydrogenase family)